jgi:primosomal protein N' (replication factor Y)
MVNRFRSRFGRMAGASGPALGDGIAGASGPALGDPVAVLHSGLGEGERFDEWSRIRSGEARIVIGARSAVFAPLDELGLVVVDEEHDGSYKQDEAPRYHGRDAAMWRASRAGAVLVLGTATPSLEAVRNVELGKLTRLRLPERSLGRPLPPVELVDLRTAPRQTGSAFFSLALVDALRETLAREEQAILFLNRRGFASLVRCGACKAPVLCANCSLALTWHQAERRLRCHRCDYSRPLPETCPACGAPELKVLGLGTERIAQELAILFPAARVLRVDSDSLKRRGELERVMGGIRKRAYDLIIGTQILSKGHDFPYITLVGAVLADVSLNLPDFRAPERTFQLLTQMAGRAGRGERAGRVLIQTYNPQHYALLHVLTHDPDAFAAQELAVREAARVPPFASQVLLWASSPSERGGQRLAENLGERARAAAGADVEVLGPAEAPIKRLAGRWRWMVLLRGARSGPLQRAARQVLDDPDLRLGPNERVAVDVDPYNVM